MKKTKLEKGITLIALVITIVVLLILALVSIRLVMNEGLINKSATATTKYSAEEEKEKISLAYSELAMSLYSNPNSTLTVDGASVTEKNESTGKSWTIQFQSTGNCYRLDSAGNITIAEPEVEEPTTGGGVAHNGIIPEGATYTAADGTVYSAGQAFPQTVAAGDTYIFDDYEYKYKYISDGGEWREDTALNEEYQVNGWGVKVKADKMAKNAYSPIITTINGKNTTYMMCTFMMCESLTVAPEIPSTVVNLMFTFYGCGALTSTPNIPNGVQLMEEAFEACTSLTTATTIPSSVESLWGAFNGCTALGGDIVINANITDLDNGCGECFKDTVKNIKITGSATNEVKQALAASAAAGNVQWE